MSNDIRGILLRGCQSTKSEDIQVQEADLRQALPGLADHLLTQAVSRNKFVETRKNGTQRTIPMVTLPREMLIAALTGELEIPAEAESKTSAPQPTTPEPISVFEADDAE